LPPARRGRKEEAVTDPRACLGFLVGAREPKRRQWWRRVGRRAATVPAVAKAFPAIFGVLGAIL